MHAPGVVPCGLGAMSDGGALTSGAIVSHIPAHPAAGCALMPAMTEPAEPVAIRVLIVDDHDIVRVGLGRLLAAAPDIEVVGVAGDGEEAVDLTARHAPDVVLMDLEMPGVDGIEATRRITGGDGAPSVVVLTSFSDRERITEALDSGAVGYLLKESDGADVVAGVRAAARGTSPIDPHVAMTLVQERRSAATADGLTDREREVLALVGAGVPNKQIALRLGISTKTVKSHLSNVFRRIGVSDRFQAALWARRHGLVEDGDEP
jgi:DNA-binding NarL/FixJ family response regulator